MNMMEQTLRAKKTKKLFSNQIFMLLAAIIVIVIAVGIAFPPFLEAGNITNIMVQVATFGIIAVGMSVVMISKGLDLSVGQMVSVCCASIAMLASLGVGEVPASIIGVLIAVGMGALNGFIISRSKAEPFIITLGMMYAYQGLSLIVTNGKNVYLPAGQYVFFGRYSLFGVIPMPIIVLIAVMIIIFLVLKFTRFGRRAYAIGGNELSAYLSGIKVKNTKLSIYILLGFITGIASLVQLSRLAVSVPGIGDGLEMRSIAACVIGGVSLAGGKGSVIGTFLGMMLLGIVQNALNLLGVPSFYQYIFVGGIIVAAVVLSNMKRT